MVKKPEQLMPKRLVMRMPSSDTVIQARPLGFYLAISSAHMVMSAFERTVFLNWAATLKLKR